MFLVTHFRSEFIRHSQATILRRVTMTQFLLVILLTAVGVGGLGLPYWMAPILMGLGYVAGMTYQGEVILKRVMATLVVGGRSLVGAPRLVNLEAEWAAAQRPLAARPVIEE